MAYAPVTRTVVDTDRRFVFSFNHISDGSNGGTTTIDASGLTANKLGQACTYLDIEKVRCNISTTAQNDSALVAFDASTDDGSTITYTTNLNTGVQYKWNGIDWTLSFEGEYRNGTWRLGL